MELFRFSISSQVCLYTQFFKKFVLCIKVKKFISTTFIISPFCLGISCVIPFQFMIMVILPFFLISLGRNLLLLLMLSKNQALGSLICSLEVSFLCFINIYFFFSFPFFFTLQFNMLLSIFKMSFLNLLTFTLPFYFF